MIEAFLKGFGVGAGLIIAIGAQNAFVLSQGVRRSYPLLIALICWFCDCVLITAGVAGLGKIISTHPGWMRLTAWGGAAFLIVYGFRSLRSALAGGHLETNGGSLATTREAVLTTLAVTLLNPHVYLDTVVLLGSLSGQFVGTGRYAFAAGAIFASLAWFLSLSLGARLLAPLFRKRIAWRILDSLVCLTMWGIAVSLLKQVL